MSPAAAPKAVEPQLPPRTGSPGNPYAANRRTQPKPGYIGELKDSYS